jgi:hypothetical protein
MAVAMTASFLGVREVDVLVLTTPGRIGTFTYERASILSSATWRR